MTIARAHLIEPSLTRWYHCVTRCVRRAHLLGDQEHNRREWIEGRLEELAGCFAVAVGGFSVMNNHADETSDHTSIKQRLEHVEAEGQTDQLEAASQGSALGSLAAAGLEESLWLCPIEDRRELDSSREGMITGFPLGSYVRLVDLTARLFRPGKATISAELARIFDRLGTNARSWQVKMKKLSTSRSLGRVFAASQAKLEEIAERLSVRYVVNLARCPTR